MKTTEGSFEGGVREGPLGCTVCGDVAAAAAVAIGMSLMLSGKDLRTERPISREGCWPVIGSHQQTHPLLVGVA